MLDMGCYEGDYSISDDEIWNIERISSITANPRQANFSAAIVAVSLL